MQTLSKGDSSEEKPLPNLPVVDRKPSFVKIHRHEQLTDDQANPNKDPCAARTGRDSYDHRLSAWDQLLSHMDASWAFEALACLISLAALVGIIVVLRKYDNQPIPELPYHITFNSVISILATLLKGCLLYTLSQGLSQLKWIWFSQARPLSDYVLYDQASRGPWGSLTFFFRRRLDILATLAGLLTIAAIAIDPFSQQIVAYDICMREDPSGTALLPRVEHSTLSTNPNKNNNEGTDMKVAWSLMKYLSHNTVTIDSAVTPSLEATCSTSNCTIGQGHEFYQSLIMEYNCSDITTSITKENSTAFSIGHLTIDSSKHYFGSTAMTEELVADIASIDWLYFNSTDPANRGSADPSVMAATCGFNPYIAAMNATVSAGIVTTEVISKVRLERNGQDDNTPLNLYGRYPKWALWRPPANMTVGGNLSWGSWDLPRYAAILSKALVAGNWTDCTNTSDWTDTNSIGVIVNDKTKVPEAFYRPECLWSMPVETVLYIQQSIAILFAGGLAVDLEITSPRSMYIPAASAADNKNEFNIRDDLMTESPSFTHLLELWNYGDVNMDRVNTYAKRITETFTNSITMWSARDKRRNLPVMGRAQVFRTCAHVRWGWISLPAALVLLAHIFLVSTIIKSKCRLRSDLRALKSSPLALLFYRPLIDPSLNYAGRLDSVRIQSVAHQAKTTFTRQSLPKAYLWGSEYF